MNETLHEEAASRRLEIRTVEVITGRGRSVTLSSVRCPVRERTAPVEECAHCGNSAGIAQDVLSRGEWVRCQAPHAAEEPGAWPPVRLTMRRSAVALRPALAASTAASALRTRGLPEAPVVDGEGRPVGWVTEAELLRARAGAKVAEAMSRTVLAVSEAAPLSRAAALLAAHGLERAAVVSGEGIVVGVLSALDVIGWIALEDRPE